MTCTNLKTLTARLATATAVMAAAAALLPASGCASKDNPPSAGTGDSGLPINSGNVTYAQGWNELDVDANSAKNVIDASGHYHTNANYCRYPGEGVYDVPTWNALAANLNRAATGAQLTTPRCWDAPNASKFFNPGVASLVLSQDGAGAPNPLELAVARLPLPMASNIPLPLPALPSPTPSPLPTEASGPRLQLFELKNGQICTTIADSALADAIMQQIEDNLVLQDRANITDCPNYRPGGVR